MAAGEEFAAWMTKWGEKMKKKIFEHVNIFDGIQKDCLLDQTVAVEAGKISVIRPAGEEMPIYGYIKHFCKNQD